MANGITIKDTVRRTGLTTKQVRYLIARNRIRHRRLGGRILLHPVDVQSLESGDWSGNAVRTGGEP